MKKIDSNIVCAYLYTISRHGYPPPAKDTVKHLHEMHAMGFRSVELEGIREAHLHGVEENLTEILSTLDTLELYVPYFCIVLPELSAQDQTTRKKNLSLFRKGCQIAHQLGSKGVIDNGPLPPWQFPADIPIVRHYEPAILQAAHLPKDMSWDRYWKALVETYRQACDIAAEHDLTYQMHPAIGVLAASTDSYLYFAEAVNRSNLRFNFDTANLFAIKENLSLALLRLAKHIDYIHLSDNHGTHAAHLPIGAGQIRWKTFFDTLGQIGFEGTFGIDIEGTTDDASLDRTYIEAAEKIGGYLDA